MYNINMKPIREFLYVKPLDEKLDFGGLESLSSSFWVVVAKGDKCGDEYDVGDIIEAYVQDELPRCSGDSTYVLKDSLVLGVEKKSGKK